MTNQPPYSSDSQQYFLPNQALLLIEHPDVLTNWELARLFNQFNGNNRGAQLREPHHVLSCPPFAEHGPFSLVSTTFDRTDPHPQALLEQIDHLNDQSDARSRLLAKATLRVASPNWIAGSTPGIGWGGPAARPVGWKGKPVQAAEYAPFTFRNPPSLQRERRGAGVEVVILDTAPSAYQLAQAYRQLHTKHPLVDGLLRPGGRLRVSYAAHTEFISLADYDFPKHPYNMADHGLFSAGIIHSIAPHAALHLVEVLHPYGVGDVDTIVRALWRIAHRQSRHPLVINMSLGVNIPQPDYIETMGTNGLQWKQLNKELSHRMCWPLQWVCDVLREQGVILVAAAGNDARAGVAKRPSTRYPAAFDSVVGVGALVKGDDPATYSNQADVFYGIDAGAPGSGYGSGSYETKGGKGSQPLPQGVATFGGDVVGAKQDVTHAVEHESVLGIYTGEAPQGNNTHGWAWWAGTSFAAPVVSGTLAALLSENANPAAALRELERLTETNTGIGPVFPVHQG
jgi:hypothetical protein